MSGASIIFVIYIYAIFSTCLPDTIMRFLTVDLSQLNLQNAIFRSHLARIVIEISLFLLNHTNARFSVSVRERPMRFIAINSLHSNLLKMFFRLHLAQIVREILMVDLERNPGAPTIFDCQLLNQC
jgi:hypothetical protein